MVLYNFMMLCLHPLMKAVILILLYVVRDENVPGY